MEAIKRERASAKRAVTKQINAIRQKVAEHMLGDIPDMITDLRVKFKAFSEIHDKFTEQCYDADLDVSGYDEQLDECDEYFFQVQSAYTSVLEHVELCRKPVLKHDPEMPVNPDPSGSIALSREMLSLFNLPKVELQTFDGNPLHYHSFVKTFDANVDKLCSDPDLKLTRLLQYVSGTALEAIRGCQLIGGAYGYRQARDILQARFGNSHLVTERILKDLKSGKPVKSAHDIQQLADDIQNASLVLKQLEMTNEVNAQSVIIEIVGRLPNYVQMKWKKQALKHKHSKGKYPEFAELVAFIGHIAEECNDPVYGSFFPNRDKKPTIVSMAAQAASTPSRPNSTRSYARPEPPCVMCSQPHRLWHCSQFRSLNPSERLGVVNSHRLCHNCLRSSHPTESCGKQSVCLVEGCGRRHTMWIHCDQTCIQTQAVGTTSGANSDGAADAVSLASAARGTLMPIVEVTIIHDNKSLKCLALLDSGSSNSFCSQHLVQSLGINGERRELKLSTLSSSCTSNSDVVNLSASSSSGEIMQMRDIFVVAEIPVTSSGINISMYPHLRDITALPAYDRDVITVDLLIGQDNAEALVPLEVRRGQAGQPFGMLTKFGWCLNGKVPASKLTREATSNLVSAQCITNATIHIAAESQRCLAFVSNAISLIHEHSRPEQSSPASSDFSSKNPVNKSQTVTSSCADPVLRKSAHTTVCAAREVESDGSDGLIDNRDMVHLSVSDLNCAEKMLTQNDEYVTRRNLCMLKTQPSIKPVTESCVTCRRYYAKPFIDYG